MSYAREGYTLGRPPGKGPPDVGAHRARKTTGPTRQEE